MRHGISLGVFLATSAIAFGQQANIDAIVPTVEFTAPPIATVSAFGTSPGAEKFPNFIGFLSSPVQSIDPRSLTQIWPIFGSTWVSPVSPLPSGDIQVYGAGLNVAITDRLSIGANQGGYAVSHFDRRLRGNVDRDGWLDLGGFAQYTLIENVPSQFLLTAGLRFAAPTGEAEVFQGHGPVNLAPYLTAAKEWGRFHVLATTGYEFPVSGDIDRIEVYYVNLHFDYQVNCWLYPVLELNNSFLLSRYNPSRPIQRDSFQLSNFESTGNVTTAAIGANFVIVRNRMELGAVYSTPLGTQRDIDFDGLLVKMIVRF